MFIIDEFFPNCEEDIYFNKDIYDMLKRMSNDTSIPHIIFYGTPGSGKKVMLWLFLEMLFDKTVYDIKNISYDIVGSGGKIIKEVVKQSDYHISIEPKNTNFDRYLIHDIVKEYAKRISLGVYQTNRSFRCVQINNLDNLSYYAQTALRRMMENYSDKCKFIMWCNSLSRVIKPLRSRCMCIRVPRPQKMELLMYLVKIAATKGICLNYGDFITIYDKSNRNIKTALWELQIKKFKNDNKTDYEDYLHKIINIIHTNAKNMSAENFHIIRNHLFNIMITNINGSFILKDLLNVIIKSQLFNEKVKSEIILVASDIDNRLTIGRREIIHFDLFIIKVIKIISGYNSS
jgi:replication factor C subunit 3/5